MPPSTSATLQVERCERRQHISSPRVPPHPGSSGEAVSRKMSALRRRDNAGELAVRRLLHRAGYRYRVCHPVPGFPRRTIDIAFTRSRVAVFIDGCFWHGCPDHGTRPRANADWWSAKLAANHGRDEDTNAQLLAEGWRVIRAWEHEHPTEVVDRVVNLLRAENTARDETSKRN